MLVMGSYGIGLERNLAAVVEENHDENGICWPVNVAPYEVCVTVVKPKDVDCHEAGERLYEKLAESGIDVIIDDRDERPGVEVQGRRPRRWIIGLTIGNEGARGRRLRVRSPTRRSEARHPIEHAAETIVEAVLDGCTCSAASIASTRDDLAANVMTKKAVPTHTSDGGSGRHLFDGHVHTSFRAYYSMPSMTSADGTPCNAAYGFANTLIRYATEEDPSHVGVCFDAAMTSFRNEVEPEYKAQRGEPPDDLEPQFDLCHEISVALGFAPTRSTTTKRTICSGRSGRRSCVGSARRPRADDRQGPLSARPRGWAHRGHDLAKEKTFDADAVRNDEIRFVSPAQIPDYLGLVGDKIDNLPGVPGIGHKSAAAVLQAFEAIESMCRTISKRGAT